MKDRTVKILTKAGWLLFYVYIILLSYFLFFSEHYGRGCAVEGYRSNLEFLKEIKRFIRYRQQLGLEVFVVNILGNILAFAPFGFLLPQLSRRYRRFWRIALLSVVFSLAVETTQLVLKVGIFDVDDILMNTLGGILGYVFYFIISRIYRKLCAGRRAEGGDKGAYKKK
ncbi:glycopeptide antibiotics resistance protein [Anaerotaenia torta]|uniref:VanZ family protein n=1 Tax=Anaerotaenia torta TaxID=433293 RepID=UPI003D1E7E46